MHSGIISDEETKKVYIEMLPGQQSYSSSTKNSITSNSYTSFNGSYKFVSSPNKQINTSIGDITSLIDNGPRNKDHGKVIITFLSQTPPKQLENDFDKMRQKIIIDIEINTISEKIRNKYEIDNKTIINQKLAEDALKLGSEISGYEQTERERLRDLANWTASVDIQKTRLAAFQDDRIKRLAFEKKILENREKSNFEKTYSMRIPDKRPCSDWDSRYTDIGTDCWANLYTRGVGIWPKIYPCSRWDSRYRDDGTSCYLDPVGRTAGSSPHLYPCSRWGSYTDSAGSCWRAHTVVKTSRGAPLQPCPAGSSANGVEDCWTGGPYTKSCR
jgi:hypothetical protein